MTDVKATFNQQLKDKVAGKSTEKKVAPEELVERAAAAMSELQDVIAELAGGAAGEAPEEGETR